MMSPVSERVVDASPPEWEGRVVRSLTLEALALLQAGQSGFHPDWTNATLHRLR